MDKIDTHNLMLRNKLAAEQGLADAQNNLGYFYANGLRVTPDLTRAYMWRDIAASNGIEKAARGIATVQKDMTSANILKGQQLAPECLAKNYQDC